MKSKRYFFLVICFVLIAFVSCRNSWLEEKPDKALTVPATLSDFQGLLDHSDLYSGYPRLGEMGSDDLYLSDAVWTNAPSAYFHYKDAYVWSKTVSYFSIDDWNQSYRRILINNIILEGLEKLKPADEFEQKKWRDVKGQALFNRARNFFELVQIYAPVYTTQSAGQNLGIVLKLEADVTRPSKRSTVQETYEQILKDLNEAKELLPARPLYLTRASSIAVNALLCRVYLSMANHEAAFLAADDCLKQYSLLLDYNDIPADASVIGLYNKEVLLHTMYFPGIQGVYNNLVNRNLFDLYGQNDLRRTRFFIQNINQTISFKGMYAEGNYLYFNGLATDEVYLTRAECHARAGRVTEAMKDLNDLLVKRWDENVVYVPLVAANADEALAIILRERRKELVFRGVRWMDLRRLNKDPRFAVTLTRTVAGQTYTLEPNSYKYTLPIPDDIINATGMQQNAGWK